jgi:hypothetical protein
LALAKTFEAIEAVSARYERLILDPDQNRHNREHLKVLFNLLKSAKRVVKA